MTAYDWNRNIKNLQKRSQIAVETLQQQYSMMNLIQVETPGPREASGRIVAGGKPPGAQALAWERRPINRKDATSPVV